MNYPPMSLCDSNQEGLRNCGGLSSPLDKLKLSKNHLEQRLNETNEAIEALEKNPEIVKIMTLLNKVM